MKLSRLYIQIYIKNYMYVFSKIIQKYKTITR